MEYQEIAKHIEESPAILIGIGNELQIKPELVGADSISEAYVRELCRIAKRKETREAVKPYLAAYEVIKRLTEGKNYFIVTTNTDGMLEHTGFDRDRIVSPCGSVFRMQCGDLAHGVWEIEEKLANGESLCCPVCRQSGSFNIISNKPYNEAGYLGQWEKYTGWLQRTINRKLFLLELGEGFETPTVIRWAFEKIAYINQKSVFVRVNRMLPQMSYEIKERAYSVKEDSISFLGKISELLNR